MKYNHPKELSNQNFHKPTNRIRSDKGHDMPAHASNRSYLQMAFHAGKETSKTTSPPAKPKNTSNGDAKEYTQGQVQEINKKVDGKIQKVEENILQWIDEETKCLKDSLEKDITAIRSEVDEKNIELNSKVQATISNLKEEVNDKVAMMDTKLTDTMFNDNGNDLPLDDSEPSTGTNRQIMDLKNRLHSNCNTLRFLCSEPLSVQFSIWHKGELELGRDGENQLVTFNWVNSNVGGAVIDGKAVINLHFSWSSKLII